MVWEGWGNVINIDNDIRKTEVRYDENPVIYVGDIFLVFALWWRPSQNSDYIKQKKTVCIMLSTYEVTKVNQSLDPMTRRWSKYT